MGKGKPRKYPDKKQNLMGGWCQQCDIPAPMNDNNMNCELGYDTHICNGNPHNCIKVKYHQQASLSDRQKNEILYS